MRGIVIYESLWGNTAALAKAIGDELASSMSISVVDSDHAPQVLAGYDLVVVGSPTHAFSMPRPSTRETAVEDKGAPSAPQRGIREWLDGVHHTAAPIPVAVFDTRVDVPRLPGSAAKAARRELRSLWFDTRIKAESFRVQGYEGPLVEGELERALSWARSIERAAQQARKIA